MFTIIMSSLCHTLDSMKAQYFNNPIQSFSSPFVERDDIFIQANREASELKSLDATLPGDGEMTGKLFSEQKPLKSKLLVHSDD